MKAPKLKPPKGAKPDPARAGIVVELPGKPKVLKRHRDFPVKGRPGVRIHTDPSKADKVPIQWYGKAALKGAPPFIGPVRLRILVAYVLPTGEHDKPGSDRAQWCDRHYGDATNVIKLVEDAFNSVVYFDDCQVADLGCRRVIAPQGIAPYVKVWVDPLPRFVDE